MEVFQIVMTSLTAIFVAIIGGWFTYREARDKKIKKLEAEAQAIKEAAKLAEEEKRDRKLTNIESGFKQIQTDISTITNEQQSIKEELIKVSHLSKYNLEYTQEINNALLSLSERIIDTESDEALRKVMQEHREKTSEIQKRLFEVTF